MLWKRTMLYWMSISSHDKHCKLNKDTKGAAALT